MAKGGNSAPVIIKKIKKGGAAPHHGGAWKVAYADFVTAMMAFFLLLWLLNVTTDVQKRGIADYFDPRHVEFGPLRVINEDRIAPGRAHPTCSLRCSVCSASRCVAMVLIRAAPSELPVCWVEFTRALATPDRAMTRLRSFSQKIRPSNIRAGRARYAL